MNIQEFHRSFELKLDKTQDFEYPSFSAEQIDFWLNEAQDRFVKSRAFGNNLKKDGFEETQKRIDDLSTIVKTSTPIIPTKSGNEYINILPNDYLYLVRHRCTVVSTTCGTSVEGGIQVSHDELNEVIRDPFWKPQYDDPLYYFEDGKLYQLGASDFTITNTILTYIRQYNRLTNGTEYIVPQPDVQCELPGHTHAEIVDIAVSLVLENIESQRYQTNLNELTKTE